MCVRVYICQDREIPHGCCHNIGLTISQKRIGSSDILMKLRISFFERVSIYAYTFFCVCVCVYIYMYICIHLAKTEWSDNGDKVKIGFN